MDGKPVAKAPKDDLSQNASADIYSNAFFHLG